MALSKLSTKIKTFIVSELATFETPTNVRAAIKENFAIDISLPAILHYDGTRPECPAKWRTMFVDLRTRFLADQASIPIANKSFRLRELDRLYKRHAERGPAAQNPVEMRATLEQAAKEAGNSFSNVRELTGKGGKPLMPDRPDVVVYLPDNGRGDATPTPALSDRGE